MQLQSLRQPVPKALALILRCAVFVGLCLRGALATAQSPPPRAPELPQALSLRPAFGSLCALAPLSCALIDRPFALAVRMDVLVFPKATATTAQPTTDATGLMLPFSLSVPILGRAEVGLGSCYLGWFGGDAGAASLPRGLCPFWVAAKGVLFPWFSDAHRKPALAAEYQLEYPAGPFSGRNLLGLSGPLSKASLAYRHPIGPIELGLSASVLVDHTTRVGSAELGAHFGYKLPVGEFLWAFAQAGARAPSWGPQDIAPKVAGFIALGAQQRADFGAGAGFTLLLSRSEVDTSVSLLLRFLSFEFGPHIKPLFPPKPKPEPLPLMAVGVHTSPAATREAELRRRILHGACYLRDAHGNVLMQTGLLDPSGTYCDWDGLRLPLGSPITRLQRVGDRRPMVRGGSFEAGAVAGMDKAVQHWMDLAKVVREHGPGILVPDKDQVKEWAEQWVAECGSQPIECIKDRARRSARVTADQLRAWGQKPRDEQIEAAGELLGAAIIEALPSLIPVPGAGKGAGAIGERAAVNAAERATAKAAERAAAEAAERAASKAGGKAVRKAGKEAAEDAAEHVAPAWTPPRLGYVPAPEVPRAFPNVRKAKKKTPVQGGGGKLRSRWIDEDGNILEWDYQHGRVEMYNKKGKHLGEFDADTGAKLKGPDPTREVER